MFQLEKLLSNKNSFQFPFLKTQNKLVGKAKRGASLEMETARGQDTELVGRRLGSRDPLSYRYSTRKFVVRKFLASEMQTQTGE